MKSATGFHYTRIEESIKELIMEESLPDSIDVEGHGLITAFKSNYFIKKFVNLLRFRPYFSSTYIVITSINIEDSLPKLTCT